MEVIPVWKSSEHRDREGGALRDVSVPYQGECVLVMVFDNAQM